MATSADEWWDSLPEERKTQIMGWLDRSPGMVSAPGQLMLLAAKEDTDAHDGDV
ncbi:hypothetical protein I6I10_12335 [Corynebacterium glucuronolyticum]|uniref:Uncharacterized protein n=1 Tax=Corynebacterium glucuronolyticum TaxID=39791 RepID=A0A7T4JUU7_9CORY|nr:hypothetical protein [Corynebacterium glucuronolyticum]QQB46214.1 hypothetical protein I6I10_12335 [Corynebacterium glucuronolyticum]WKD63030.1 hypothetical protein CGLUCO_03775 [Corynebacterium glucuronolyticum DSM 44120]SMB85747.1 hypothetical protein SAMN05660745_01526 [Corynebacterium glucuronolyticum]